MLIVMLVAMMMLLMMPHPPAAPPYPASLHSHCCLPHPRSSLVASRDCSPQSTPVWSMRQRTEGRNGGWGGTSSHDGNCCHDSKLLLDKSRVHAACVYRCNKMLTRCTHTHAPTCRTPHAASPPPRLEETSVPLVKHTWDCSMLWLLQHYKIAGTT